MMLVDSNIIIYSAKPEFSFLLAFIEEHVPMASAISYVEVVGYNKLTIEDRRHFEDFFADAGILPITEAVILQAAGTGQQRKMSVADAIIAATALRNECTLVTRNRSDFDWIQGLQLQNPFDALSSVGEPTSSPS